MSNHTHSNGGNQMKLIGLIALVIFLITASIDIDSAESTLSLLGWGLIIIASLSVAGLTLTQQKES